LEPIVENLWDPWVQVVLEWDLGTQSNDYHKAPLKDIDARKWFGIILIKDWPKTQG
jgi:hypothetical protein